MSWEMVNLEDIFNIARGGSPRPIQDFITERNDGINWIMIGDTGENEKYINSTKKKIKTEGVSKSRRVYKGDFLLTNSMSFGRPYLLNIDGCIHDGWLVLSPKDESIISKDFFYYLLGSQTIKSKLNAQAAGAIVKNLNTTIVKAIQVPLPPLPEQQRIADILDKAEAITQKREQALALCDEFLRATFLDMFGDPVSNPKGWDVKYLEQATNKITDGTHHSPPITDEGIPYITAKHLKKDGLRFFDNPWYISLEDHKNIFSRCNPEKGDVLYIKDGATTGIAAINEYDFEFSMLSSLALIKCDKGILNPYFLCAMLNNDRNKQKLISNMGGAAIKRLTLTKIKKIEIIVPPIELQQTFSEIVEKVNGIKARIQQAQELPLFDALSQQAFKGELTQ